MGDGGDEVPAALFQAEGSQHEPDDPGPVSYTHLDVYKRQQYCRLEVIRLLAICRKELTAVPWFWPTPAVAVLVKEYGDDAGAVSYTHRPGVESYKKKMFARLGKPGYEDQKAELEARLGK